MIKDCPYIWRPQKPTPRERFFTKDEISKLLAAAETPPHIQLAMQLLLSTAGRMSAILELTWDRVDFDRRQINLRNEGDNTRKGRAIVPMNDGLYIALQTARHGALSDYVVEWAGGPVRSIRKGLSAVGQRVGIPNVGAHIFRHTAAVHLAEGGVPMSEIAQFLGHSNTATTERVYARYSPAHLRKAADILDFTTTKKRPSE
jgi:integrase